ncbi:hypothetical protein ACH5RR_032485 [Cinchona calisaya]|uniref:CCHC-type domain-containing protein n=1 Tax=Cinchona calisaya TaxID=153742 RepID=A0ABD2YI90_9GENT
MVALQSWMEGHPAPVNWSFADAVAAKSQLIALKEISQYKSEQAVFFSVDDIQHLSLPFKFALICKLSKVWIYLVDLPVVFFYKIALFSISQLVCNPLKINKSTAIVNQPNVTRFCIECDSTKELPSRVWVGKVNASFWQSISYDDLHSYCDTCNKVGHLSVDCHLNSLPTVQQLQHEAPIQPQQ